MRALALAVLLLSLTAPALVHADAIGGCPEGQHFEANPVEPGAMHHGGGQCVDDPGGCTISHGAPSEIVPYAIAIAIVAIAIRARRRC